MQIIKGIMSSQQTNNKKNIKVPDGRICDYIDGKFRKASQKRTEAYELE
jgi:hypothetical protein